MKLIVKAKTLSLILVCGLTVLVFQPQRVNVSAGPLAAKGGDAYTVIALVNEVRAAYGLSAYNANSALMSSAQAHSDYQASVGSLTHTGKGGSRPGDRAVAAGYGGGAKVYVTENIYGGRNASPSIAVNWWQGDATHLNTMISPSYTDVGVGIAEGNGVVYYTMDVGYVAGSAGQNPNAKSSTGNNASSSASNSSAPVIVPVMAATPQADGSIIHTVKEGQAMWNIAAIYNISIADLLSLNGLTENSFIHPGDKMLIRAATTISATQTVTATQMITLSTPTIPISITNTATVSLAKMDTPTLIPQAMHSGTPQPTIIVIMNTDSPPMKKVDPVLLAIGALVVVGIFLVILGSVTRKAS
jgi:uncharacterized protein YkwD